MHYTEFAHNQDLWTPLTFFGYSSALRKMAVLSGLPKR